ncbi:MAG TPA: squalene/phytoene synthase family protein [Steroidobacteraceae bacterium]|nr:squalene/phytoene synthase family protein [Steroidobacteraceae bacterium]
MPEKPEAQTPRFFAWLYSTPSQQPLLATLCAIEREIGASLRPGIDHHVAHARLEWWREECGRCAAGNPVHPLTRELRAQLERRIDPAALAGLAGLVDTARFDLARATFERREELTAYCRRWAEAMITPACYGDAAVDSSGLGAALREIELLGELAREARSGRLRLPLEELAQARTAPEAIATPPWSESLSAWIAQRHEALRRQLSAAIASVPPESQQRLRGLLVWSALSWHLSLRAQRALPFPPAASLASAAAASWHAWRAARAAAAGRLRLAC